MAFMDLFKKKDVAQTSPAPELPLSDVPIAQVSMMQDRGLTNNQIIQSLQRQGYSSQQVYDALSQSEQRRSIAPLNPEPLPDVSQPDNSNHPDAEKVAEQIIEEKWSAFQKEFVKMQEWKDSLNVRLDKVEQMVVDVRSDLEGLHKAIVSRVGEYDKTLIDVGTEIKAMEKVFQDALPQLTENIQELSRITKKVKGSDSEQIKPRRSLENL